MKTPFAIRKIEHWSYDYIKMDCDEGKCYGVLAVRPMYFAFDLMLTPRLLRFIVFVSPYLYSMRSSACLSLASKSLGISVPQYRMGKHPCLVLNIGMYSSKLAGGAQRFYCGFCSSWFHSSYRMNFSCSGATTFLL